MTTPHPRAGLRPLTPYEPRDRRATAPLAALTRRMHADGQLAFELPPEGREERPDGDITLDPRMGRRVLAGVLEVCDGRRQPAQLRAYLGPAVYHRLVTWPRTTDERYLLRTFHAGVPSDGVVEAFGTVHATGGRILAVAASFRILPAGIRCTSFDLIGRQRPGSGGTRQSTRTTGPRPSPRIRIPEQRRR